MRSYGQYCPIALAAEVLAERWIEVDGLVTTDTATLVRWYAGEATLDPARWPARAGCVSSCGVGGG
ncbi:hypothetical protein SAMN05421812_102207 [Asanoa hainanensis]|uniref:Uncharacterized protein n=1 Tax=Asanoa hainanensis TaxID=560556 RepID=A0A239I5U0_9ACTN|nr:hypothetical protein [Asanoa hainanensis]SNS88453.1 hypothetical protein SAMN05421812_102207 [Asanoa hainanensis]